MLGQAEEGSVRLRQIREDFPEEEIFGLMGGRGGSGPG